MLAGGYMHHDDLACYEQCLREVAAIFGPALKVLEIGTWSGHTSRSANAVLLDAGVNGYEHWIIDKKVAERGVWEPPFPGCHCVWKDSADAADDVPNGLGLVLVDGCHCLSHVLSDFALYSVKLSVGGLMLFHDVNPQAQGGQYQYHGDPASADSYLSVRRGLELLGLLPPEIRNGWALAHEGGYGSTWWGGLLAFRKTASFPDQENTTI